MMVSYYRLRIVQPCVFESVRGDEPHINFWYLGWSQKWTTLRHSICEKNAAQKKQQEIRF
jgi:hypothetical protein